MTARQVGEAGRGALVGNMHDVGGIDQLLEQLARQIVELTVLIGTYNMNARVLQALELDLEPLAD